MQVRLPLLGLFFLALAIFPASARQLAVGAAAGYFEPPGFRAVPVYTWPRGGSWTPTDTSMGYPFREPIYWTPRGYRYVYVRGYYWKRLPNPYAVRTYRRPVKMSTRKVRRGPCITDAGFGRYETCRNYY